MNTKEFLDEVAACYSTEEIELALEQHAQVIKDEADRGNVRFFLKLAAAIEERES